MKGFFLGALGLIGLEVLFTSKNAGPGVGGLFDTLASGVRSFVDPAIPAFRYKTPPAATSTTSSATVGYRAVPNPNLPLPSQIAGSPVIYA